MQFRTSCKILDTVRWDFVNKGIGQNSAIPSKTLSCSRHLCSGSINALVSRGSKHHYMGINESIVDNHLNLVYPSQNTLAPIPRVLTGSLHPAVWSYPSSKRYYSTVPPPEHSELTTADKLKRAVKEYGATVIVFHVAISIASLGISYAAVSSGLDVTVVLSNLGISPSILESKVTTGAGTFVIAYALHKVFAPVRISITLTATPFIVRYLRKIGFLKPPKPSKTT